MSAHDKVNILLVDDQPAKLLSYEAILGELGENLIQAGSAREALTLLLKTEIAVLLVDVCMPELDGFELAAMIREHPRFRETAIIFVSAVHMTDLDRLRGYGYGAVDYLPVPIVPGILRAKVKVFVELFRKTRQLEQLNQDLERRVAERTAELQASTAKLRESEQRRSLALAAGGMGSWDCDLATGDWLWDEGQCRICGVDPAGFVPTSERIARLLHPEDRERLRGIAARILETGEACDAEFRVVRPGGELRWCVGGAAPTVDGDGRVVRVSGVTLDITERKRAEERQALLAREVDHRARNILAVVQAILRLTRADTSETFVAAVEGRIKALARAHGLLSQSRWEGVDLGVIVHEELAPYRAEADGRIEVAGPPVVLEPASAQSLALALHELATNAAKHGGLSVPLGRLALRWTLEPERLVLRWTEAGGPGTSPPSRRGFGTTIIHGSIENQLGGGVSFDWRPEGLRCTLSVPVTRLRLPPVEIPEPSDEADAPATPVQSPDADFPAGRETGAAALMK